MPKRAEKENHKKLCNSFLAIVGLGAVGSAAAILLVRAGVARLRLVDGSRTSNSTRHALARAADHGRLKVDVCAELMQEVLPHLRVEVRHQHLVSGQEVQLLGAGDDGRLPDMFLDCMGGSAGKEMLMRFALQHRIPVISVAACPTLCAADPSRVTVAKLCEVWASPATAALRQRLVQQLGATDEDAFSGIDVVHSQEGGLWAKGLQGDVGIEHRLQLGVTAAATAILRLTGGRVPQQADPCGMNFWKKLRHNLERQEPGAELPDLYGVGCVADYIWRARSALSRVTGAKHSDMALTRWDHRKPPDLGNLVLMTAQEAQQHHAECKVTGSLPPSVLEALDRDDTTCTAVQRRLVSAS